MRKYDSTTPNNSDVREELEDYFLTHLEFPKTDGDERDLQSFAAHMKRTHKWSSWECEKWVG